MYLCISHHTEGINAIHKDRNIDIIVKKIAQKVWMEYYNKTKEEFIKIYGKNYL